MNLDPIPKILIVLGALLILLGLGWQWGWLQNLRLGRLPGDIVVEKENFRFYFPLTTGLLLSALLTLISWFFRR